MSDHLDTVRRLGQGQRVRLTFPGDRRVEAQVNQMEYVPEERLRVELTTDESGDYGRYHADASVADGRWSELRVQRYDPDEGAWTDLGGVEDVTPVEMFHTTRSSDMDAQRRTGEMDVSPR